MNNINFVKLFATAEEKAVINAKPTFFNLYRRIALMDFHYSYIDNLNQFRAAESRYKAVEQELTALKDINLEVYEELKAFWNNLGDEEVYPMPKYRGWYDQYSAPEMARYRFLETLTDKGFNIEQISHAMRAVRHVSQFLLLEARMESPRISYPPRLIYTSAFGSKRDGVNYINRMSIAHQVQTMLSSTSHQVGEADYESLNRVTIQAGIRETDMFRKDEIEENFAFIGNYYFKIASYSQLPLNVHFDEEDMDLLWIFHNVINEKLPVDSLVNFVKSAH